MSWRRQLAKLRNLFNRQTPADLDAEMRAHLEMEEGDNLNAGMSPEEAHYAAMRRFGNMSLAAEESRNMWRWNSVEAILQDLRFGLRHIRRSPGFAISVVLTLALGIGANSAIFSVVNAVVLRPLPYPQPDRLMVSYLVNPRDSAFHSSLGIADFQAAYEHQKSFSSFAAVEGARVRSFTWTGGKEPIQVPGNAVTAEFFTVLGVNAAKGRHFAPGEDAPGRENEVVISHSFWKKYLNSDPGVIGRTLTLNGASSTIIGVMPADFYFGAQEESEIWPLLQLPGARSRPPFFLQSIGRLKPGVTEAEAQADLSTIAADIQRQFPEGGMTAALVVPLKHELVGEVRVPLLILLGAVVLVLLIATVNVANLEIAQATARDREITIRAALGAGRGRIIRQALTESLLLASISGAMGLLLAYGGVHLLLAIVPGGLPRVTEINVNGQVVAFTAIVSLLSGILFGLAPTQGFGRRLNNPETLRGGTQNLSEQRSRSGLRNTLIILEVSLSLVLLIGAGLLLRSFDRLTSSSPGFNPQSMVAGRLSLPKAYYPEEKHIVAFYDQLLDRVQHLPGVASAGITLSLPPDLLTLTNPFWVPGQSTAPGENQPLAVETTVSPDYFRTLGISLLRGRFFTDSDRGRKDGILIINETMARRYFKDQDPVGQRIKTGDVSPDTPWETIIGVVSDVKYSGLDSPVDPTLYVPYFQSGWTWFSRAMYLVIRARGGAINLQSSLRTAVQSLDPNLPLTRVRTMDELLSRSVSQPRFRTQLLTIFAAMALLLAAIGIFGVMAYVVSRRTQEIGVRMALGASRANILGMVLGDGLRIVLVGVAMGLVAAFALTRLIKSWLFAVQPADPGTFLGVSLMVIAVAGLACYVPARRATKVDPIRILRYE